MRYTLIKNGSPECPVAALGTDDGRVLMVDWVDGNEEEAQKRLALSSRGNVVYVQAGPGGIVRLLVPVELEDKELRNVFSSEAWYPTDEYTEVQMHLYVHREWQFQVVAGYDVKTDTWVVDGRCWNPKREVPGRLSGVEL